jgi:hypothetical protein
MEADRRGTLVPPGGETGTNVPPYYGIISAEWTIPVLYRY